MRSWFLHIAVTLLPIAVGFWTICTASEGSSTTNQVADNDAIVWGGEHIELHLTKVGGTVEFDCANGTFAKPVTMDSQGKFRVSGTYTRESPGPTLREGNPAASATYSGSIVGGTMRLHIVAGTNKEEVGDFVLIRGESGRVMKCR